MAHNLNNGTLYVPQDRVGAAAKNGARRGELCVYAVFSEAFVKGGAAETQFRGEGPLAHAFSERSGDDETFN